MLELEQAIELLKETQCRRKDELLERIVGVEKSTSQSKEEYLTEKRFADGVKCPYCTGPIYKGTEKHAVTSSISVWQDS